MKNKFLFAVMLLILFVMTACVNEQPKPTQSVGLPNPASVFCGENGGTLEMRQDAAGDVAGICVFPDNSECDEWAYFRSECKPGESLKNTEILQNEKSHPNGTVNQTQVADAKGGYMPPGSSEPISDWWGVIKSNPAGSQYDDYFERQDLGQVIYFGIDSLDPTLKAKIVELRDSGTVVHLYGTLFSNVPDVNGSQIQVDRIE